MNQEKAKKLPKYIGNPLLKDMPQYLKDPKNFKKIQRELLETLSTRHSHSEIIDFAECFDCQQKVKDHAKLMRKHFTSPQQYMEWQKVHTQMNKTLELLKLTK